MGEIDKIRCNITFIDYIRYDAPHQAPLMRYMQARNNHAFYTELYNAVEFLPVASDRYGQQPRDAYHYGGHNQAEFMGGYQL